MNMHDDNHRVWVECLGCGLRGAKALTLGWALENWKCIRIKPITGNAKVKCIRCHTLVAIKDTEFWDSMGDVCLICYDRLVALNKIKQKNDKTP